MNRKILTLELIIINLLMIAVYVVSVFWSGFTQTGSGMSIPDSTLTVSVLIFIGGTLLQVICLLVKKGIPFYVLSVIKVILVELSLYIISGYALNDSYINAVANGNFYDHIWLNRMVVASMILPAVAFFIETLTMIVSILRRKLHDRDQASL